MVLSLIPGKEIIEKWILFEIQYSREIVKKIPTSDRLKERFSKLDMEFINYLNEFSIPQGLLPFKLPDSKDLKRLSICENVVDEKEAKMPNLSLLAKAHPIRNKVKLYGFDCMQIGKSLYVRKYLDNDKKLWLFLCVSVHFLLRHHPMPPPPAFEHSPCTPAA